jgi:hypothetical protein
VGDDEGGDFIIFFEAADEVVDGIGDDGVEAGGGFIVEDALGVSDDGAGESDAFAHAAGEFDGHFLEVFFEFNDAEGFADAIFESFVIADTGFAEGEGDVLGDVHGVEEGAVLEEDAEFAADGAEFAFLEVRDFGAIDDDGALIGLEEADEVFEEDAFTAAAGADEDGALATGDIEVDAAKDVLMSEGFLEAVDFEEVPVGRLLGGVGGRALGLAGRRLTGIGDLIVVGVAGFGFIVGLGHDAGRC